MSEKKEKKKMLRKPENFEELEKEFETVLNELLNDENLERFRNEYEKLHQALVNSHESEQRLMSKVRELNNEIAANAEKVATALRLSKDDETTISSLQQESDKAWKMVEYLQEKEVWSRETITALRLEIDNLTKLVERGADLAMQFQEQEPSGFKPLRKPPSTETPLKTAVSDISTSRPSGTHFVPRKPLTGLVSGTKQASLTGADESLQMEYLKRVIADLEAEDAKLKNDIYQYQVDLRNRTIDLQRERTRRNRAEQELLSRVTEVDEKKAEIADHIRQVESLKESLASQDVVIKELRISFERSTKEVEVLNNRLQKTMSEAEKFANMSENLQSENTDLQNDIRLKHERLSKMSDNVKALNKAKDNLTRKVKVLTEQRSVLRHEKEVMQAQLMNAEKTIESSKRLHESDEKQINRLMRERDVFNKNLIKQVHATEKQANLVSLHEHTNRNMGHEIKGFRRESEKQRRIIQQLERERDRYISDNGDLTMKVMKGIEELQTKNMQILDYQKRTEELESRLKIQQNLYEAVHQDRNTYSRQLIETQDEMNEMKNKLRVLEHQSQQLKEEVAARETAVVKEHLECIRLEKERDSLTSEIQLLKKQQADVAQIITDLRAEEKNLQKVITSSDEIIKRQKRELDTIICERDILGSQLVRRNDELSLMYQKAKLLQTLLNNGNRMYDQRMEDIRLLRLEVRHQRHQNRCLKKNVATIISFKQELYSVHREILHERARCAALENELSHPRQIHRWRSLAVTDPSKFELLQKVQALQKRLIGRTEEVVEVERVLQEKDRLYLELRAVLERQPGPEVATQVTTYQRVLKAKNRQLKSLVAELNMYESDNKLGEYDLNRMEQQVLELKKKYYMEKKRRQDAQETKILKKGLPAVIPGREQFAGGGFKITNSKKLA